MTTFQRLSCKAWLAMMGTVSLVSPALAADFGGSIPAVPGTPDPGTRPDPRAIILKVLTYILNFLALAAVIFIIIAGIRLIVSQGEEEQKNKAKKTILYVIIGLIVILFARVVVGFFTSTVPAELNNF